MATQIQSGGLIGEVYRSDLANWLKNQEAARKQYLAAEKPLTALQAEFAPGGTLTKGQMSLVEEEGRRAGSLAMADLAATGMSSGSAAAGLKSRVGRDVAAGKVGVEQNRVTNLSQVLQNISALRSGESQRLSGLVNPYSANYMSGLVQGEATRAGVQTSTANRQAGLVESAMNNANRLQIAKMSDTTTNRDITEKYGNFVIPRITL